VRGTEFCVCVLPGVCGTVRGMGFCARCAFLCQMLCARYGVLPYVLREVYGSVSDILRAVCGYVLDIPY